MRCPRTISSCMWHVLHIKMGRMVEDFTIPALILYHEALSYMPCTPESFSFVLCCKNRQKK